MTDTGQIPGEGLPEHAGMVEQPGIPAPDAYTFLDPSEQAPEDDDLLLMPAAQGAWSDGPTAPGDHPAQPAPQVPAQGRTAGGAHGTGSADHAAARTPADADRLMTTGRVTRRVQRAHHPYDLLDVRLT
ncbi:hypothetical protein ABT397_09305, partial [Streptomyces halstedii]|uniref:hypothetical protein n=1 Tax=Streptomyces halstedii TaxID=1944 RepID=UPI003344F602